MAIVHRRAIGLKTPVGSRSLTKVRFGSPKRTGASAEAIEAVYRLRFRAFVKVAASVTGEASAADAVHNAFVRALRHRRSFRGESSLETWLWRLVTNAALDLRQRSEDGMLEASGQADHFDQDRYQNGSGAYDELEAATRRAILDLPPRQRLVVFLRYFADLDYRTIADVLEIRPGTVAATLHNAHQTIRRQVEEAKCKI